MSSAVQPPKKRRRRELKKIEKVISGGQTGTDQIALRVAKQFGLATGGTAPPGFQTIAGPNLALRDTYGLTEMKTTRSWEKYGGRLRLLTGYQARSMQNVDDSDATIAFRLRPSAGTDGTINYARSGLWSVVARDGMREHRPVLVVTSMVDRNATATTIIAFLRLHRPSVINVCGHRDNQTAGDPAYSDNVAAVLRRVFGTLQTLGE